jgi:hypothetical protein
MALPPQLSEEARNAALAKAAQARKIRAELKERLKMRSITLAEVIKLAETDDTVAKTKVLVILESLPGLGKVKARKTLETVGIAETRRLQGLGEQQKAKLLDLLGGD